MTSATFPAATTQPVDTVTKKASTQTRCTEILQRLLQEQPAVGNAVMATVDGRAYASGNPNQEVAKAPRVAAITSSLLGLAESFSRESLQSTASYNSIATEHGTIVLVRVPSNHKTHALCLWTDRSETFAMTLRHALDTASKLAAVLDDGA
ncbi:roadblock/LC7 domain-containing protein [Oleiagrimonas soli]|nr:hypothetical protein [Oleiagrimonas soli]MBB6183019.1 putative regulator of Ras-like GTPase activity (Roadblock/LC7/MglB family) [Oleiagrimonas soli]